MTIKLKRVCARAAKMDGTRILVDRLWPRGLSEEKARIDLWPGEIASSTELRKWFGHDSEEWKEFRRRYRGSTKESSSRGRTYKEQGTGRHRDSSLGRTRPGA